jgi:protease-4
LAWLLSTVPFASLFSAAAAIIAWNAASLKMSRRFGMSLILPDRVRRDLRRFGYAGLMVKFLIGLVTGVALVFLSIILLFVIALRFREGAPVIASNSVLVLRVSGDLPEKPPMELPSFVGEDHTPLTVIGVWSALEKAAADTRIKAVVFQPEGLSAGWAKLEELRLDIDKFKKSGKPVIAYLRQPGTREYYVASGADRIYLGPSEPVMVKGLRAEMMYFKKTLDKIGVNVEIEHAGKYKDFGDMFTRSDMSQETREVMTSVMEDL